ncbi:MAG: C39 family peptidase [Candidatus Shapirobacteria bacterium]|nr:C39 family peptidase [Candidatus Shapirobacteria bacterium]
MLKNKLIFVPIILIIFISFGLIFLKKYPVSKVENKITQISQKVEEIKESVVPVPTKILSSGLPNKHLIKTAFVPQSPEKNWDQPWQDACEEASLLTVDYYYRQISQSDPQTIKNDLQKIFDFETQQSFTHDVNLDQMALVAQDYLKYTPKIINNPTIEDIKTHISQDIPIIVPANGKTLYQENKHFKDGGPYYHNLVILGYDDNTQKFTVHDVGTQFGAYFKYTYSLLMESIHDFPKSLQKEDINQGDKKILILLK